jgi:GNAT superfamily N-acetyltransferase
MIPADPGGGEHPDVNTGTIEYRLNKPITPAAFVDVLRRSGLAERRPVDDAVCMAGMLENTNLLVTAWDRELLVAVSRSVTDFHYACYLSDLAVDAEYQRTGIGKMLIQQTKDQLGPKCQLILLAAPAAADYYGRIGFEHHPRCWTLAGDRSLRPSP